jgi:hypothetical protein
MLFSNWEKVITCAIETDPRNPFDETPEAHIFLSFRFFVPPTRANFWYGCGSST